VDPYTKARSGKSEPDLEGLIGVLAALAAIMLILLLILADKA
jgi:hypothetical protein